MPSLLNNTLSNARAFTQQTGQLISDLSSAFKAPAATPGNSMAFSFGDPEPVLSNALCDYTGAFLDTGGKYYIPPVSLPGLAKLMNANPHHNSILHFKKNMVLKWFQPSSILSYNTTQKIALDYFVTGNFYLQIFRNSFGKVVRLGHLPAVYMRPGKESPLFYKLNNDGSEIEYQPHEVLHILEPDITQGIYGMPEYLGGIQSVLLSEEAGLFRRKYYSNGAHMGYILLTNDAGLDDPTAKLIEEKVTDSKGPGNFRSLYLNISRSTSKEPVQIIPVGDISTKDEFERIKNITKGEILSMHRMQPGLAGVIPENTGGFGDPLKIMQIYYELEVGPMQQPFLDINERLELTRKQSAVSFSEPDWKNEAKE